MYRYMNNNLFHEAIRTVALTSLEDDDAVFLQKAKRDSADGMKLENDLCRCDTF